MTAEVAAAEMATPSATASVRHGSEREAESGYCYNNEFIDCFHKDFARTRIQTRAEGALLFLQIFKGFAH
jgi:hypothetical protein